MRTGILCYRTLLRLRIRGTVSLKVRGHVSDDSKTLQNKE